MAQSTLDETDALIEERGQHYGDPAPTWARIAEVWSGILDHEVTAYQAELCMAGMKLVRAAVDPEYPDSLKDAKGYIVIAERQIL